MEDSKQKAEKLASLNDSLGIVSTEDGKIEISDRTDFFDILCAAPYHPYCNKAEENFVYEKLTNEEWETRAEIYKNRKIIIHLRNRNNLELKSLEFEADILEKHTGVRSGIIINPPELAGLICAPLDQDKQSWVVARPFQERPQIRLSPDNQLTATHIYKAPRIYPNSYPGMYKPFTGAHKHFGKTDQGVIDEIEKDFMFDAIPHSRLENFEDWKFKVTFEEEKPPQESPLILISNAPCTWPRMGSHPLQDQMGRQSPFFNAKHYSRDYLQFTRGSLVREGENTYFLPNKPISNPNEKLLRLFTPSTMTLEALRKEQSQLVSTAL